MSSPISYLKAVQKRDFWYKISKVDTYVVEILVRVVEEQSKGQHDSAHKQGAHVDDLPELVHVYVASESRVHHVEWQHQDLRLAYQVRDHL